MSTRQLLIVRERLARERLAPYEAHVDGDLVKAMELYEWNMAVSSALFETLGVAEVILRNAFHAALHAWHLNRGGPGTWFDHAGLDSKGRQDLANAKHRATQRGKVAELPAKVVSELSFGFWRYLLAKRYQATVWPVVGRSFIAHPAYPKVPRLDIERAVERLHILRNRVAHHEPVYRRNLSQDYSEMTSLVGWICPDSGAWMIERSRVPQVLAARP